MKYLYLTKFIRPDSNEITYCGDNIKISVKDRFINSITVYIPIYYRPSSIINIYDIITGYIPYDPVYCPGPSPLTKDLYPYELLTKLEPYFSCVKDIREDPSIDNPQIYLENINVHCENDTIIITAKYGKCYSHNSYGIANRSRWDVHSERSKLYIIMTTGNEELNKKGDNNMKIEGTIYFGSNIEISVTKGVIDNIKLYIPTYSKIKDIFEIYDTITGYMSNDTDKDIEKITDDDLVPLYTYPMLTELEKYYPYIKNINKTELKWRRIYVINTDLYCENDTITITVNYTDQYNKAPNASVVYRCMCSDRTKIYNIALREHIKNSTYGVQYAPVAPIAKLKKVESSAEHDGIEYTFDINAADINAAFGVPTFEAFDAITDELKDTYIKKNHDYGNSFDKSIDKFGLTAAVVRMSDKMERLSSLLNKDAKVDESIRDTVMDLANYCIMTAMYLDNKKGE